MMVVKPEHTMVFRARVMKRVADVCGGIGVVVTRGISSAGGRSGLIA
jgi:hypothetical protein